MQGDRGALGPVFPRGEEARLAQRRSSAALTSANCALLSATLPCTRAASSSLTFVRILGCNI